MITNTSLARSIALNACLNHGYSGANLIVEDIDNNHAPYEGVLIARDGEADKCVHVYMYDDDAEDARWMIDPTDLNTGTVDPLQLTAESLQYAMDWLIADGAWMLTAQSGFTWITTDREEAKMNGMVGTREPLTNKPGGELVGFFDPTTGDLCINDGVIGNRFTKPLYKVVRP